MKSKIQFFCVNMMIFWIVCNIPLPPLQVAYLICGCYLGVLLPDIDTPESKIGRKIPILPEILNRTIGHRTLTHSILFIMGMALFLGLFLEPTFALAISMGCLFHITLDLFSGGGIALFYPLFKFKIGFGKRIKQHKKSVH